ncbi:MAG: MoxR family ATPase [Nocardioides sp.]|uniref:AAA family ATPase n=1 Tax=Nocardioides sp. TaxID=35761 RepID=UPI0039E53958
MAVDLDGARQRIQQRVVGREREIELALAATAAGRDLVLEGPPGTSKTTILRAITAEWGIPLLLVEGNGDLTPAKLIGHHDPARVLREDYRADNFVPGPLVQAMSEGGFLYVEEVNRAPEDVLNALLTAMADRRIEVPRVGLVEAKATFRVVASMNPFDNVGTTRLSTSIGDRLNRIVVDYQDEESERRIVMLRAGLDPTGIARAGLDQEGGEQISADAVAVTRATRTHELIRAPSSVRGAIDCAMIMIELVGLRQLSGPADPRYPETFYDAMLVSLSGRIRIDEAAEATAEQVLRQIWEDRFVLHPAAYDGPS